MGFIAGERERPGVLIDRLKARVSEFTSDSPLEKVDSVEALVDATRRKKAKKISALLLITRDQEGVHATVNLRTQQGDQARVTVLNEAFPEPAENESEEDWRLRVAYAVDIQLRQVEQATHHTPRVIDFQYVGADGQLRTDIILPEDRQLIRDGFSQRHLDPIEPILPQPIPTQAPY